ncbi:hypothetical protein [Jannaschia seohaensis]|uniref:O-antigen ligase-like membrane protein n=1 Tax=Jannaschia seohaensis TaxID=475081 RepID=A0A2Y9A788_9RHOB|nr:hypothetical protein [Jannaschia seohaensis]PWJ22181.1 hypothetical protein BCF38_101591 [Jannaschia seohaensis]SSA38459.1 hypothetical protein SAMN05421539_101591 [Jannaschia seohaensis]
MQLFPTSLLVVLALVVLAMRGPQRGFWAFMALLPFAATAAFNLPAVGGASILLADIGALGIIALLIARPGGTSLLLGTMRLGQPGFWIALLTVWAIFCTMAMPRLFAGETLVFSIARAGNENGVVTSSLRPSTGNLTQLFRHLLGVCIFLAAATIFRLRPDPGPVITAMAAATGLHIALGVLDVLTYHTGLEALMEPFRTANYAILWNHEMIGLKRMIGGFPEASSFGYLSLGLSAVWLHLWLTGVRRRLSGLLLFATLACLIHSTSSSAYVGLVAFLSLYGTVRILAGMGRRVSRRGATIAGLSLTAAWLGIVALYGAYHFVEPVQAFFDRALFDKLEGASGQERGSWNAQALINFADTWGLGAGLGSVRASSWVVAVLASLGLIGAVLYAGFLRALLLSRGAWRGEDRQGKVADALRAGCVALLVSAVLTLPTPDLGLAFYAMAGAAAGLSRGAALARNAGRTPQALHPAA